MKNAVRSVTQSILICGRKIKKRLDYLKYPKSEEKSYNKKIRVRKVVLVRVDRVMVRDYSNPNEKE